MSSIAIGPARKHCDQLLRARVGLDCAPRLQLRTLGRAFRERGEQFGRGGVGAEHRDRAPRRRARVVGRRHLGPRHVGDVGLPATHEGLDTGRLHRRLHLGDARTPHPGEVGFGGEVGDRVGSRHRGRASHTGVNCARGYPMSTVALTTDSSISVRNARISRAHFPANGRSTVPFTEPAASEGRGTFSVTPWSALVMVA